MYELIKAVLNSKNYELADMLNKISTMWLNGQLTEDQYTELTVLARSNANPENSYAPLGERVTNLETMVTILEERVTKLETASSGGNTSGGETGGGTVGGDTIPDWAHPTGAYDAYRKGNRVKFNGKIYESVIDGNVWSPAVYPAGWTEVTA